MAYLSLHTPIPNALIAFLSEPEINRRSSKDFTSNSFTQRKVGKRFWHCFHSQKSEHNRVPSKQWYYRGSQSLTTLKICLGAVFIFLNKGSITNLIIWENWHLKIQDDWDDEDTAATIRGRVDNRFFNLRKAYPKGPKEGPDLQERVHLTL